jgi:hypothetical protein
VTNVGGRRQRETQISKRGNTNMATKTATKTNRNAKAASKATTTIATKKATVAKPAAKEWKTVARKPSQLKANFTMLDNSRDGIICKERSSRRSAKNFDENRYI